MFASHRQIVRACAIAMMMAGPAMATVEFQPETAAAATVRPGVAPAGGARPAKLAETGHWLAEPGPMIALAVGLGFLGLQARRRVEMRQVSH
jgi:hypothetical protein